MTCPCEGDYLKPSLPQKDVLGRRASRIERFGALTFPIRSLKSDEIRSL